VFHECLVLFRIISGCIILLVSGIPLVGAKQFKGSIQEMKLEEDRTSGLIDMSANSPTRLNMKDVQCQGYCVGVAGGNQGSRVTVVISGSHSFSRELPNLVRTRIK